MHSLRHQLLGALAAGTVMMLVSSAILREARYVESAQMSEQLHSAGVKLESGLRSRLLMTRALSAFVHLDEDFSDEQFLVFATALEQDATGVRSLQLARGSVVTYLTHPEQNKGVQGHDLFADPERRRLLQRAVDRRQYIMAGPIDLVQGGVGLIGRLPIYLPAPNEPTGDRFWGFASVLLDLDPLLAEAGIGAGHPELTFSLRGKDGLGAQGAVFYGEALAFSEDAVAVDVAFPNGSWQLTATVKPGAVIAAGPSVMLWATGTVLSLLVGWLIYSLLQTPQSLRVAADKAVAALQESERRVQGIAANIPGAVYQRALSRQGVVTYPYISPGFYDLLEVAPADVASGGVAWGGVDSADVTSAGGAPQSATAGDLVELRLDAAQTYKWRKATVESAFEGGRYDLELKLTLPSGEPRRIRLLAIVLSDGDGGLVWDGIILDITKQKLVEEQLRQAHKMEALGQLTGGMAHDFNNLLAIVVGNLELLEEDCVGTDSAEFVKQALEAAGRGAKLTRSMLTFARQQSLARQVLSLNELVESTVAISRAVLSKAVTLTTQLDPDLWPISNDAGQLGSALLNLVINARDAMPNGGNVHITTCNVQDQQQVELAVADTGTGMSPEMIERAFEPFFTTKPVGQGSGLGLSMIYGLVQQSGGEVAITSPSQGGTCISLRFPRATEDADGAAPTGQAADVAAIEARGEVVLLVEDDAGVRQIVHRQLLKLGYQVHQADDAVGALAMIDDGLTFDLMLTDVIMPRGMSGFELGGVVHERTSAPVIYMSGNHAPAGQPLHDDAVVLPKPVPQNELAVALRAVLDLR